jgi:DNA-binding PadR family transcriptional regulator
VSPVFRHGRLRLYLLKLLDESPRHGYEVIRLLQDRFMGVYAPSPGTIYPRLARLEEDGLVTHEDVDGKKVYSITDKGREEIRSRLGDLADLEDELTESLRDVAREISEDVRDTVRTIREELASAAREFRADGGKAARYQGADTGGADGGGPETGGDADSGAAGAGRPGRSGADRADDRRVREEARRRREQMRASFRAQGRSHGDWAAWAGWSGRSEWPSWASWADWASGRDEPAGEADSAESTRAGAGAGEGTAASSGPGAGTAAGAGTGSGAQAGSAGAERSASDEGQRAGGQRTRDQRARRSGQNPFSDLERMAIQFATELRAAAKQTGDLGERSLNDLRDILTDTLAKVRAEVFPDTGSGTESSEAGRADAAPGESASHDDSPTVG